MRVLLGVIDVKRLRDLEVHCSDYSQAEAMSSKWPAATYLKSKRIEVMSFRTDANPDANWRAVKGCVQPAAIMTPGPLTPILPCRVTKFKEVDYEVKIYKEGGTFGHSFARVSPHSDLHYSAAAALSIPHSAQMPARVSPTPTQHSNALLGKVAMPFFQLPTPKKNPHPSARVKTLPD